MSRTAVLTPVLTARLMMLGIRTLADAMEGADVFVNTYWVRFPYRGMTFERAVENSRRLFEAAQDGVLLVEATSQRILDANPFMLELLGRTREELRGRTPCELGLFETPDACQRLFGQLRGGAGLT